MSFFFTLASSSSGNSYYYGDYDNGIIIDCGVSCRYFLETLKSHNINPENISAILLTHEHNDHIKGLITLQKKYKIPIYASENVINYLRNQNIVSDESVMFSISCSEFKICKMNIIPFHTSHDSLGSLGYKIVGTDSSISICTDTGFISEEMAKVMLGSDLILLESNYEKSMLEAGPYPYSLKRRIESPLGHLSNTDCSNILPYFISSGTRNIILAHLSPKNNIPDLAKNTAISALSMHGFILDRDYTLNVAPKSCPSDMIFLGEKEL